MNVQTFEFCGLILLHVLRILLQQDVYGRDLKIIQMFWAIAVCFCYVPLSIVWDFV